MMRIRNIAAYLLWVFKGIMVGFGAILPGVSGGTLCVAFGMYRPLMDMLSHPIQVLRRDGLRLFLFVLGGGIGFVGLAGFAGWLMKKSSIAVTCAFVGFILGTLPGLWKTAGERGRGASSYISMCTGFALLLTLLLVLRYVSGIAMQANIWGFLFCGLLWGLSFVVPGLSSSTLLIFFGLYEPMLDGIAHFSMKVLIPLVLGVGICLLALPKAVNAAYRRWYAPISHAIIGVAMASVVTVVPTDLFRTWQNALIGIACIVGGAALSFVSDRLCARLEEHAQSPSPSDRQDDDSAEHPEA